MRFEWLETFELGVPEIDNDHRAMLALMKALQSSAKAGDRRTSVKLLDRLLAFSHDHFAREEAFLRRWNYQEEGEHRRYHEGLYARAQAVKKACAQTESRKGFDECCEEMMSFLVDDIVRGDLGLKSFLQDAGLTLPA